MNDTHYYEVNLIWHSTTLGTLSSPAVTNEIEVVTPPEFPNGIKEKWTPEHLFVAAINACLMSTFILVAKNSKFDFISYKSNGIAKIEKVDGKFSVSEIILKPSIVIPSSESEERGIRILEMSENSCAIANSIKTKITLDPIITIKA